MLAWACWFTSLKENNTLKLIQGASKENLMKSHYCLILGLTVSISYLDSSFYILYLSRNLYFPFRLLNVQYGVSLVFLWWFFWFCLEFLALFPQPWCGLLGYRFYPLVTKHVNRVLHLLLWLKWCLFWFDLTHSRWLVKWKNRRGIKRASLSLL